MQRIIRFDDPLYSRMYWVDMRDVSKELQWKVLEYHNQKFVLERIAGGAFTEEQHRNFLDHMDEIIENKHRYQYIVYFDDKPVGKYSFTYENGVISDTGNYLFYEKDLMTGLGMLKMYFFQKFIFEVLHIKEVKCGVRKDNHQQVHLTKKFGAKIIGEDENIFFFRQCLHDYVENKQKIEKLLGYFIGGKND